MDGEILGVILMKTNTTVSIEYRILREARNLNINISQAAEDGIRNVIEAKRGVPVENPEHWLEQISIASEKLAKIRELRELAEESKKAKLEELKKQERAWSDEAKMKSLDLKLYNTVYKELRKKNAIPTGVSAEEKVKKIEAIKKVFFQRFSKEKKPSTKGKR
jgi:post-segregation antitoxin (ccd killing protein)